MTMRTWLKAHPEVFTFGPGAVTGLMLLGTAIYYPWRHYNSWPAYAILAGVPVLLVWHGVLIAEYWGWPQVLYAFANLGIYVLLGIYCAMLVTGDAF